VEHKFTAGHRLLERLRIAKVTHSGFCPQIGNIIQTAGWTNEQPQFSTLSGQRSRYMATDKSRRSCNEDFHALA
jgi:hypothetical protein